MSEFFKYIQGIDKAVPHISAAVVSGPHTGERALLKDGEWLYRSKNLKLFDTLKEKLSFFNESGLISIDGNDIFCEPVADSPQLVICGAGHVSMPVIRLGKMLSFFVTVIDDRESFCQNAKNNGADTVLCQDFSDALSHLSPNNNRYFIAVTRGHEYDIACLKQILNMPYAYVGMMGSKIRAAQVSKTLLKDGVPKEKTDTIHMPVGLAIKAETPEEIAVSIMAQIILEKNSRHSAYSYSKEMLLALIDKPCALATILVRHGSAPRGAGTKMVVLPDGVCIGTVGGGIAESKITKKALECIKNRETGLCHIDMSGREAGENGMVCGGHIDVFIETVNLLPAASHREALI